MNFGGKKNSVIPQLADLWEKNMSPEIFIFII